MNSSQVIKRTLPLIIVLVIIIGIAVSCTVLSKDKITPAITNEEGVYLSITEDDRTYSVTNKEMYDQLKTSVGLNVLLNKIDTDLLKKTPKGDSNYWNSVSEEDIDDEIEKAIFPNGKDDLTAEEIADKQEEYEENMFVNNGLRTTEEIRDYHRLVLAKKAYASVQLQQAIDLANQNAAEDTEAEKYYTEDEIEKYYKANYLNGYWTIIVPFSSEAEGENLLKQLGIKIEEKDPDITDDFDKWVKEDTGDVLTPNEVIKVFIDMYNTVKSHEVEGYPTNTLKLVEGRQYELNEGKITFNHVVAAEDDEANQDLNELYFTNKEISEYQSEIQQFLKVSLTSYNSSTADALEKGKTWYTPKLKNYNNASLYTFILKIDEEAAPTQSSVEDEIIDALKEAELTTTYIETKMADLRKTHNITIYDEDLEKSYIANAKSYEIDHKATKEENKTIVAKVGDTEYSADALFSLMDKKYGMTLALTEINFQRLLNNPNFNKIYDYYNETGSEKQKIIDAEKWQSVRNAAVTEKQIFTSGQYEQYGYGPAYGWKNFLKTVYGVSSDEELLYYFLYSDVMKEYSESLADVTELEENADLWKTIEEKMTEKVNEYYKVTGIHLLISVNDDKNNPIDPEDWTDLQHQYAKELYQQIWAYYKNETGTSAEKFQNIADAFSKSLRFIATLEQNIESQPQLEGLSYVYKNIDVAKFKTAGLNVKFEDLKEFTNGSMVENFDKAVKSIWDANPSTTSHIPYGNNPDNEGNWNYLVTEFGYHTYVNTSTIDIARWDEEGEGVESVIPTLQMVKTYLKDSASLYLFDAEGNVTEEEFTEEMKTAVTTYFTPIRDEIIGNYYTGIELYKQLKEINITFNSGNYTTDDFKDFLDLRIQSYQKNLNFFSTEE